MHFLAATAMGRQLPAQRQSLPADANPRLAVATSDGCTRGAAPQRLRSVDNNLQADGIGHIAIVDALRRVPRV
jgi:hypothetical protein